MWSPCASGFCCGAQIGELQIPPPPVGGRAHACKRECIRLNRSVRPSVCAGALPRRLRPADGRAGACGEQPGGRALSGVDRTSDPRNSRRLACAGRPDILEVRGLEQRVEDAVEIDAAGQPREHIRSARVPLSAADDASRLAADCAVARRNAGPLCLCVPRVGVQLPLLGLLCDAHPAAVAALPFGTGSEAALRRVEGESPLGIPCVSGRVALALPPAAPKVAPKVRLLILALG